MTFGGAVWAISSLTSWSRPFMDVLNRRNSSSSPSLCGEANFACNVAVPGSSSSTAIALQQASALVLSGISVLGMFYTYFACKTTVDIGALLWSGTFLAHYVQSRTKTEYSSLFHSLLSSLMSSGCFSKPYSWCTNVYHILLYPDTLTTVLSSITLK